MGMSASKSSANLGLNSFLAPPDSIDSMLRFNAKTRTLHQQDFPSQSPGGERNDFYSFLNEAETSQPKWYLPLHN